MPPSGDGRRLLAGETTLTRVAFRAIRRRPGPILGGMAVAGAVAAILANALLLQEGRHPAPLFEGTARINAAPAPAATPLPPQRDAQEAERQRRAALLRDIQEELARKGFYGGPVDGVGGPRTESAIRDYEAAAGLPRAGEATDALLAHLLVSKVRPRDGIAQLLRQSAQDDRPERVQQAQRALNRLGYGPLREDGAMGPGTRQALERFERERKLPVRGEAAGRTLRELALASGIAID
jgi:peptidoglycan hydrolase-like protein with peptidoglycan-binding domain